MTDRGTSVVIPWRASVGLKRRWDEKGVIPSEANGRVEESMGVERSAVLCRGPCSCSRSLKTVAARCPRLPRELTTYGQDLTPFDPLRAGPAGSLSVSLSVSLSNGRIGTAFIDTDSDGDSDGDRTPQPRRPLTLFAAPVADPAAAPVADPESAAGAVPTCRLSLFLIPDAVAGC